MRKSYRLSKKESDRQTDRREINRHGQTDRLTEIQSDQSTSQRKIKLLVIYGQTDRDDRQTDRQTEMNKRWISHRLIDRWTDINSPRETHRYRPRQIYRQMERQTDRSIDTYYDR